MTQPQSDFESQSGQRRPGILNELWDFLKNNKKWWLLPLLVMLLLIGLLIILGGTGAAPLIYTLF